MKDEILKEIRQVNKKYSDEIHKRSETKEMYDEYCDKHTKLMQAYSNLKKENEELKRRDKSRNAFKEFVTNTYKQRIDKASNKINDIFKDENWFENYEYNDLEYALKEVSNILQGSDK